jgi:hypothetical protein
MVAAAQKLSDGFDVKPQHKALDRFAAAFCPAARELRCSFQWRLMQVEYPTDIVFKSKDDLMDVYPPSFAPRSTRQRSTT